jgi:mannose-6-phosphate isomerase-like protein (cupin superfamily)
MLDAEPFTEKRPWGEFRQYAKGEPVTVKTIFIKSGESLSLQYHKQRSEFWRILKGTPEVTIGDKKVKAKAGDEFNIPVGAKHRVAAPDEDAEFLEVSRGNFDENDNTRLEDKYGRT